MAPSVRPEFRWRLARSRTRRRAVATRQGAGQCGGTVRGSSDGRTDISRRDPAEPKSVAGELYRRDRLAGRAVGAGGLVVGLSAARAAFGRAPPRVPARVPFG